MSVIYYRRSNSWARSTFILCIFSFFIFSAHCDLRFFVHSPEDGLSTSNMLGAWFGPENYDVSGRLIFLEPDQDCDSVKPHSMYNETIDYGTIGDFILYWDIICKLKRYCRQKKYTESNPILQPNLRFNLLVK